MQEIVKRKTRPPALSKRIAALEAEVAELKQLLQRSTSDSNHDLRAWVGLFKDDPGFDEVVKLGRAWRRRQPKC